MHPRKFIRDSVGFATSQYLVRFLNLVRGLVAARLLGPGPYGAWSAIQLLFDYGGCAPIGTYQGLDRVIPARIVDGDAHRLDRAKRRALQCLRSTACSTPRSASPGSGARAADSGWGAIRQR